MRPSLPPPIPATDANYNAPGKAWDGLPTKLQPASGKLAAGWQPGEAPPAPVANWIDYYQGRHLNYLDGLEARNWTDPISLATFSNLPTPVQGPIAWSSQERRLFTAGIIQGVGTRALSSHNGREWSVHTGIAKLPKGVACGSISTVIVCEDPSLSHDPGFYRHGAGDLLTTWTFTAAPGLGFAGSQKFNGLLWDAESGRYVSFGQDANLINLWACIWTGNEALDDLALRSIGNQGFTSEIYFMALAPGRKVAIGTWKAGPATPILNRVWKAATVDGPWDDKGDLNSVMGADLVTGLDYDAESDLFVCVTISGKSLISQDGETWVQRCGNSTFRSFLPSTLVCRGSVWLACVAPVGGLPPGLVMSLDHGATWEALPWPLPEASVPKWAGKVDGRFAVVGLDGAPGPASVAFGLRLP